MMKITKDVTHWKLEDLHNYAVQENAIIEINNGKAEEVLMEVTTNV